MLRSTYHNSATESSIYDKALENLSMLARGEDVHITLFYVASLGIESGADHDQIYADLRSVRGDDTTDREIREAVRDAYKKKLEGFDGHPAPDGLKPRKSPPRPINLDQFPPSTPDQVKALSPQSIPEDHKEQRKAHVETLYSPGEHIYIGPNNGNATPGRSLREREDWLNLETIRGEQITANPLTGKLAPIKSGDKLTGRGQLCLADFRFLVCEFDKLAIEQQAGVVVWLIQQGVVASVVHSGGKSLHAILKIPAEDQQQFNEIAARLTPHLGGLGVDLACFTPERLTRLGGAWRKDKEAYQELLYLNPTPAGSFDDFTRALESLKETAPEPPALFDHVAAPPIPAEILPDPLGAMVAAVARATQTDPTMAAGFGLSVAATCTAGRFEIGPAATGYREPLNLFTAAVSPPATRKTAVTDAMAAPLFEWERTQKDFMAAEIMNRAAEISIHKKRADKLERDAATAKDSARRREATEELKAHLQETPEPMHVPQLITSDITGETLQARMAEHGGRMAVITDEGGIIENMLGIYSDFRSNVDIFLKGHACSSVRVDRQGRTAHIDKPVLTFGLALQPGALQDLSPAGRLRFRRNGLWARFLFVHPESYVGRRDVRAVFTVPDAVAADYRSALHRLLNVQTDTPARLVLNESAREIWLTFAQKIEHRLAPGGDLDPLADWAGKLPGACLRIAGNFHLIEHGPKNLTVSAATMRAAVDFSALLVDHAAAVFALMGGQGDGDAEAIFDWIVAEQLPEFSKSDLWRKFKGRFTGKAKNLDAALQELVDRSIISERREAQTGGKPAQIFATNPSILERSTHHD